jgi:hypothetical protein
LLNTSVKKSRSSAVEGTGARYDDGERMGQAESGGQWRDASDGSGATRVRNEESHTDGEVARNVEWLCWRRNCERFKILIIRASDFSDEVGKTGEKNHLRCSVKHIM